MAKSAINHQSRGLHRIQKGTNIMIDYICFRQTGRFVPKPQPKKDRDQRKD
jgi:hypothetical protein